ncbi:MAG TPA: tRNA (adenosine(37)-N6)-dimethylallyltransferase MiaA, partial [Abditibacteriaceae bacterium]
MTPLLILVGPTGSGKTATAIELCHQLNGEIISADSMQIYKGCDIVTAKATPEEQQAAPHHLIDICDPRETYSAARWAQDAQAAIDDILARGKVPIIAGGTGFYINALLHPETLAATPPNAELRAELEAQAQEHGNQWLHDKLKSLDAHAATRLHPNDLHRVMRAIEIALSGQHSEPLPPRGHPPLVRGL